RGACRPGSIRSRHRPGDGAGIPTLDGTWGYDTWLGADTAGADEGGDRADAARSDSPSYDRRRVGTTVLSGAPRRSLWHSRGTRGRTRSAHGSANTCRDHRRTVVRIRNLSPEGCTPPTTGFRPSS